MKAIKNIILFILILIVKQHLQGQGFANLGFEDATITTINNPGGDTYAATIPGWTPIYYEAGPNEIPYNSINLDSPGVSLEGTDYINPALRAIEGSYSIYLQGGSQFSPDRNGAWIGQTAQIPTGALSLIFWGNSMNVSFGGQSLGLVVLGSTPNYNIYGADISAFAGQTGQLLFSVPWESSALLDNIQFSSSPVPEPSVFALTALGTLLLGFRRKKS